MGLGPGAQAQAHVRYVLYVYVYMYVYIYMYIMCMYILKVDYIAIYFHRDLLSTNVLSTPPVYLDLVFNLFPLRRWCCG